MEGKRFILTTKSDLDTACQWLDANLQPIFEKHLPKNLQFTPIMENPVPCQTDQPNMTATLGHYVDALMHSIPKTKPNPTTATLNKYSRLPPNWTPKLVMKSFQENRNKPQTKKKQVEKPAPPKPTQTKKRPPPMLIAWQLKSQSKQPTRPIQTWHLPIWSKKFWTQYAKTSPNLPKRRLNPFAKISNNYPSCIKPRQMISIATLLSYSKNGSTQYTDECASLTS